MPVRGAMHCILPAARAPAGHPRGRVQL